MQSPNPQETVWLVSFADDDDRELTADEIGKALAAGEIVLTTIVWRDGMPDWKPIVEVPELRAVVQKQRAVRPRSTVMGGFASPPVPPPAQLSPRPPAAAAPPSPPFPVSPPRNAEAARALTPEPPFGRAAAGSPRGSLARGLAAPRPSLSRNDDAGVAARGRVNTLSGPGEENRTTLTGPGGPEIEPEPESDAEPISLSPESLSPESLETLESDELQSIVEEVPPEAPAPKIFEIEVTQPSTDVPATERETPVPPRAARRAREQVRPEVPAAPPPEVPRVAPAAPLSPSRGPAAPAPPRKVHAPLPQAVDPLADLDDVEHDGAKRKGGGIGKFLLAAVVLAGVGGAFYLGQKSARQASMPPVVTVQAPPIVTVVATAPVAEVAAPSAEPSAAEPESDAPAAAEPEEAKAATQRAPRVESPSHESSPSQDDRNVELSREPSLADVPASPPKPAPAPVTKPEPEPDEPAATGPFDKSAAAAALARAASAAGSCRTSGDPSGVAQVSVTFSPTGRATRAIVNGPPFAGTATGGCIASRMTQAKVPPFTGSRVTVRKKVVIQ